MGVLDKFFKWLLTPDRPMALSHLKHVHDHEPQTMEELEHLFEAYQLEHYWKQMQPVVRTKIHLELSPVPEARIGISKSKIGGLPALSHGFDFPKNHMGHYLSFIGQINCAEISRFDHSGLLPKQGLISFFYSAEMEAWGFAPEDKNSFKVCYFENTDELCKIEFPADLKPYARYTSNLVNCTPCLSIPTWEYDSVLGLIADKDCDNYMEISKGSDNQVFGYANCIQGPMELECQLVINGLYCGDRSGYEHPAAAALNEGKDDWILLLQIDSEEEKTGMMWGDSGRIYFWIKKQDLQAKRFDKCWCILQCY